MQQEAEAARQCLSGGRNATGSVHVFARDYRVVDVVGIHNVYAGVVDGQVVLHSSARG